MVTQIELATRGVVVHSDLSQFNPAHVPSTYHIHQGKRCERVDEKIVARRGPPTLDDYYLARVFAEIFCSDMSRRPSKVNNEIGRAHV